MQIVEIIGLILARTKKIFLAPLETPLMFWELAPLLITLLIVELYFGRYENEKLGWNSTVTNALVLCFVGSNLMHFLYLEDLVNFTEFRTIAPLVLIILGITLGILDFFHALPKQLAFGISSVLPINVLALVAIVVVHTGIKISYITIGSYFLILAIFALVFKIVQLIEPNSE